MGEVAFLELLEVECARELFESHGEEGHGVDDLDSVAAEADDLSAVADDFRLHCLLLQMVQDELSVEPLGVVSHDEGVGVVGVEEPLAKVLERRRAFEDLLMVVAAAGAVPEVGHVAAVETDLLSDAEVDLKQYQSVE